VGQLQLNVRVLVAVFVQYRGCEAPNSVPGHLMLVSHAFQRLQYGVIAHVFGVVSPTWKKQFPPA